MDKAREFDGTVQIGGRDMSPADIARFKLAWENAFGHHEHRPFVPKRTLIGSIVATVIFLALWTVGSIGSITMEHPEQHRAIWAVFATMWGVSIAMAVFAFLQMHRARPRPMGPLETKVRAILAEGPMARRGERIICPNGHIIAAWTRDYDAGAGDGFSYVDAVKFSAGQERAVGADFLCRKCYAPFVRVNAEQSRTELFIEGRWR